MLTARTLQASGVLLLMIVRILHGDPAKRRRDLPRGLAVAACKFRQVLVDGGAADAEQPGDAGDAVAGQGEQVTGLADLLGGHRGGPAEPLAAGAGGVQARVSGSRRLPEVKIGACPVGV